jgi:septum formation protein
MTPLLPPAASQRLVLASRSPRRRDIMVRLGFDFEVDPATHDLEDDIDGIDSFALAEELARRKCAQVADRRRDDLVVGADTVVILEDDILEKPRDDDEATEFLRRLSGATHTVISGVALMRRRDGVDLSGSERTRVTFRELDDDEIAAYVATGEGRDKAGSYAAQGLGAVLIRKFDGCYYNVVGLPVALLIDLLKKV